MATQVQFRRGNTANMSTFTGAAGEITVDTDKKVVVVHDGSTVGGTAAVSAAGLNANIAAYLPTYTGVVNAASHTVGASTVANSSGVYTAVVNGSSITVGTSFTANATVVNATSYNVGTTVVANSSGTFDSLGNVRSIPIQAKTTSYTLASGDNGTTISSNAGVTVNGAVITANQVFTIFNNSNASITITQGTGATMYLAGNTSTGNRTLANYGVATVLCVAANTFVISGAGLT